MCVNYPGPIGVRYLKALPNDSQCIIDLITFRNEKYEKDLEVERNQKGSFTYKDIIRLEIPYKVIENAITEMRKAISRTTR